MKILFVTHTAHKYGAGRSLLAMVDGLTKKGVSCHVVMHQKGPLAAELDIRGIDNTVVRFKWWVSNQSNPLKRTLRTLSHQGTASRIANIAQKWGAEMIHTNGSVTPVGAMAARKAKIPHIWHIREYGEEDYGLTYDYGFAKSAQMMASLSYRMVIISEALAKKYTPYVSPQKYTIVGNPIAIDEPIVVQAAAREESIPLVVTLGYLHPGKGNEDAILAVIELLKRGRQIELNLVGDGAPTYVDSLRELVIQNNAEDHVSFLGYLDDPGSILQMADILLVCSRSEAFGRVTVEGMLHKKPVIAARAGASSELVSENVNGLLYDPGDSDQLADAIAYLLDHPQRAQEMGENGYCYASTTFTVEKHVDAMYQIFSAARESNC